jgi:two-component system response regulator FimZ (fimbrial Z protein)
VLIVDDHAGFRASARALLEAEGFDVVAEAVDGAGGIATAARLRPAIVLLDIGLPDISGFEVARHIVSPSTVVVLVSSRETAARDPRAAACRARGFLPKNELSGSALTALVG